MKGVLFLYKISRNDLCWCGSGKKYKSCHNLFDARLKNYYLKGAIVPSRDLIKNEKQIQLIKESPKINIAVFHKALCLKAQSFGL